jgi:uncharacterized damage-inducible protein DinB
VIEVTSDLNAVQRTTSRALSGKEAHIETASVLGGLDWKLAGARPEGVPHSIFQLVNHIVYWQLWLVRWLDGQRPRPPKHATGSWPGTSSPASRKEWERTVRDLHDALDALERRLGAVDLLSKRGKWTPLELLHIVGSHTSYHIGQIVFLRQLLGAWPPPSGVVTW